MTKKNVSHKNSWPYYAQDEIDAVVDVLESGAVNQWSPGSQVENFQQALAARIDVPHVIAVANGSLALELALRAYDIGPGDEVIVTCRSFIASVSCVSVLGAQPVFVDVDRDSGNMSVETIAPYITAATKAIIPVHLGGWPCDMPAIMELAEAHELIVIEDCAQAIGSEIDGRAIGSFGHASAFSFCTDKIISTGGEGGAVAFRSEDMWRKAWSFKDHGKDKAAVEAANAEKNAPWFKYVHNSIGTNWRMTSMQAAIGIKQLEKLDGWLLARKENGMIWREALLACDGLRMPEPPEYMKHVYYRFYAYLDPDKIRPGITHKDVRLALEAAGVMAASASCSEIYLEKAYASFSIKPFGTARELGEMSIAFPTHPMLDKAEIREMAPKAAEVINSFVA